MFDSLHEAANFRTFDNVLLVNQLLVDQLCLWIKCRVASGVLSNNGNIQT